MSNPSIQEIQAALTRAGYAPGPADGVFGARTEAAVRAWLDARGQPRPAAAPAPGIAVAPVIYQGAARHAVHEIIVHCSDTRPDWMTSAGISAQRAEIRRWHLARGWADIGYHWVIARDGAVTAGRPETQVGAHVEGHNAGTIGICLIGGHGSAATDRFSDHFTPAQDLTLRQLLLGIGMRTQITRISGHNEYAAKACPGFNVPNWLKEAI